MKRAARQLNRSSLIPAHRFMSETTTTSFAAAVTTPDGSVQQPLIRCRTIGELNAGPHQQRPRPNLRSRTTWSVRGAANMAESKRQDSAVHDFAPANPGAAVPASKPTTPQPFHKPNTDQHEEHVYVLTLGLTPSISIPLGQMREEYFPKHLNRTPAHVTLFHALPHSQIDAIDTDLESITANTKPYHVSTGRPFRMRRGVAVLLGSGDEQSQHVREELRGRWIEWLSAQDSRGWQPHWTVMNKVEEEKKVAQAFNTIRRMLFDDVHHGKAVGLDLWKYDKGDWEWVKTYRFHGSATKPDAERGESYFDSKLRGSGNAASEGSTGKSPGNSKKGSNKVASIWKSVTSRKKDASHDHE